MSPKSQRKQQQKDTSLCFPWFGAAAQFGGRGTSRWAEGPRCAAPLAVPPPRCGAAAGVPGEGRLAGGKSGAEKRVSGVES